MASRRSVLRKANKYRIRKLKTDKNKMRRENIIKKIAGWFILITTSCLYITAIGIIFLDAPFIIMLKKSVMFVTMTILLGLFFVVGVALIDDDEKYD